MTPYAETISTGAYTMTYLLMSIANDTANASTPKHTKWTNLSAIANDGMPATCSCDDR